MKSTIRSIIALYFESIELIEVNAALDRNEKLNAIAIAFFDSAATNSVDNSNKENNLINVDSYATKEALLKTTKE